MSLCQSKVCGDRVNCMDCGDEIANWLCDALQRSDLRLFRQNSNHIRTNRKGICFSHLFDTIVCLNLLFVR